MNFLRENSNITGLDFSPNFTSLYVSGNGSNANSSRTDFDLKSNYENAEGFKTYHVYQKNLNCSKFTSRSKIIDPDNNSIMRNETRNNSSGDISDDISPSLHAEAIYPPTVPFYNKSESNKRRSNVKQNCDIHTKITFMPSDLRIAGELHGNHEKLCSDKCTYCRPVLNLYSQEFLYKTMEKNIKLQRLVKELIKARQKEKEIENWNNYINELRTKHYTNNHIESQPATSIKYIEESDAIGSDNTKQSHPCQNLLHDFYKMHEVKPPYHHHKTLNKNARVLKTLNPFVTNSLCYPISSQGRLIMLERERMKTSGNCGCKPLYRTINEERSHKTRTSRACSIVKNDVLYKNQSTNTTTENMSLAKYTQTDFQILPPKFVNETKNKKCDVQHGDLDKRLSEEPFNKKAAPNNLTRENNMKQNSITCIEKKLDNLIHSINNFMNELKTKSVQHKYVNQYTKLRERNVNYTRSDSCDMARREKIVCEIIDNSSSRTTKNSSEGNLDRSNTFDENLITINEFPLKGSDKNKLITLKGSIADTYHPCSVQISVTIPTKEIATEVTRSLSRARSLKNFKSDIEEIPRREDRRIAIAVNTDPLGLLSMLKVSTDEMIKRLLSYVPTIDYCYYLSRLHGPSPRAIESQFICNICGATFMKPSALTDHIQKHDLGQTRDCCVCRHVLDMPRRRPGLFKCQYCGQRFTRAYCCELHQKGCARRLGKLHDVASSLILLR